MRRQWEERTRAGDDDDERSGGERAMAMRRGACGHATTMRGEEESGQRRGGEERAAACGAVGREDLDTLHAPWLVVLSLVQNIHLKAINATSNPSSDAPRGGSFRGPTGRSHSYPRLFVIGLKGAGSTHRYTCTNNPTHFVQLEEDRRSQDRADWKEGKAESIGLL